MIELEEMKKTWDELSAELVNQKKLTDAIILKMAHEKSKSSLDKLVRVETMGGMAMAIILVLGIIVFVANGTLDTWQLILCALCSAAIFIFSGILSYDFIEKMKKVNILEDSLEDTKKHYNDFQKAHGLYKKVGVYTILPTMIFFIPVVLKVFIKMDVFANFSEAKTKLLEVVFFSVLLSVPMLLIIFRSYKKNIKTTSEAIKDAGVE
ncbi:MAG: hypothetical protein ACI9IP_000337 [Arcticibacterium sp.]|jgi:hypothetical protein